MVAAFEENELQSQGMYRQEGTWYGAPYMPVERLNPPITPAENFRRYLRNGDYQWIPDPAADLYDITPDCDPDTIACGYEGGIDEFGVKWVPDVSNPELPSFVEPGFLLIDDIADWKELTFPDVESWDWKGCAAKYNETLAGDDRMRRGIIWSSYFERLISIMTFENAAVALLEDPDSVDEFFEEMDRINLQKIDHFMDDFHCELIMIHDDWSAQRSPFFSPSIGTDLLAPHIRKLSDHVHEKDGFFILHSCGNGVNMIPAMKAAGVDGWQAQYDAIDLDAAYEAIGDDFILETYPPLPDGVRGMELYQYLKGFYDRYAGKHRILLEYFDYDPERGEETRRSLYCAGRRRAMELKR